MVGTSIIIQHIVSPILKTFSIPQTKYIYSLYSTNDIDMLILYSYSNFRPVVLNADETGKIFGTLSFIEFILRLKN